MRHLRWSFALLCFAAAPLIQAQEQAPAESGFFWRLPAPLDLPLPRTPKAIVVPAPATCSIPLLPVRPRSNAMIRTIPTPAQPPDNMPIVPPPAPACDELTAPRATIRPKKMQPRER